MPAQVKTLLTLVGNAVNNVSKPQYRRIRVRNKAFAARLGTVPGGVDALRAFGALLPLIPTCVHLSAYMKHTAHRFFGGCGRQGSASVITWPHERRVLG